MLVGHPSPRAKEWIPDSSCVGPRLSPKSLRYQFEKEAQQTRVKDLPPGACTERSKHLRQQRRPVPPTVQNNIPKGKEIQCWWERKSEVVISERRHRIIQEVERSRGRPLGFVLPKLLNCRDEGQAQTHRPSVARLFGPVSVAHLVAEQREALVAEKREARLVAQLAAKQSTSSSSLCQKLRHKYHVSDDQLDIKMLLKAGYSKLDTRSLKCLPTHSECYPPPHTKLPRFPQDDYSGTPTPNSEDHIKPKTPQEHHVNKKFVVLPAIGGSHQEEINIRPPSYSSAADEAPPCLDKSELGRNTEQPDISTAGDGYCEDMLGDSEVGSRTSTCSILAPWQSTVDMTHIAALPISEAPNNFRSFKIDSVFSR